MIKTELLVRSPAYAQNRANTVLTRYIFDLSMKAREQIAQMLTQQTQNICITFNIIRRWFNIVQMLYKCFVFAGLLVILIG